MEIPCTAMTKIEIAVIDPARDGAEAGEEWKKLLPPDHPLSAHSFCGPIVTARLLLSGAIAIPDRPGLRATSDHLIYAEDRLRDDMARHLYGEIHAAARAAIAALYEAEAVLARRFGPGVTVGDMEPFRQTRETLEAFARYGLRNGREE